ncbi:MAG TPA: VOC family protein, partial [Longimicrobiaceae bacterium]
TFTTHAPGTFCWLELHAHDASAARRFYSDLFGWTTRDTPIGPGENDVYTIYQLDGRDAAASTAMMPEQKAGGMPSSWLAYIAVENADQSAARAGELGGTVLMGPFDAMELGRMAIIQDPAGAVFAIWRAKSHPGLGVRDELRALGWSELATNDAAKAKEFYGGVFGWEGDTQNMGMEYTVFRGPTGMVAGMYEITPEMAGMHPSWLPYFVVDDAEASVEKARSLGATILKEPADIPGVGRFALLQDPQGAFFYVIKMLPMAPTS